MGCDVRIRQVGYCCLVSIAFGFENKALFSFAPLAEEATTNVDSQFEGHVEPEILAYFPCSQAREVVNRVPGFCDELDYFLDARSTGVSDSRAIRGVRRT